MKYGRILVESWKIIWKRKELLFFGFLASMITVALLFYSILISEELESPHLFSTLWFLFLLLLLVLAVELFVQYIFGKLLLIRSVWLGDEGVDRTTNSGSLRSGKYYFWRIFTLELLFLALLILAFVVVDYILFGLAGLDVFDSDFTGPIVGFVLLLKWIFTVFLIIAEVAVVGGDLDVVDGMRRAFDLIRKKPGPVFGMSVTLTIGEYIVMIPVIIILALILPDSILDINSAGSFISLVFCLLLMILDRMIIDTYIQTASTLTYRRLIS